MTLHPMTGSAHKVWIIDDDTDIEALKMLLLQWIQSILQTVITDVLLRAKSE